MYHPASIASLTPSQISKALKGLPVRVSVGNQHDLELSQEQLKKLSKAAQKGKASTITLDPFQIQNHMNLLGSGVSRTKKYNNWVDTLGARPVIDAGMSRATSSISGMGVSRTKKYNNWVNTLGARPVIDAGMSSATRAISGSGYMRDAHNRMLMPDARKASNKYGPNFGNTDTEFLDDPLQIGFGVSRRKKYNKWTDTLGARPVIDAGMSSATRAISGFGLKKRGRPRKTGGALYVAGQN